MEVEQRFDPDDFEVDDEQRVKVKKSVVAAQAASIEGAQVDASGNNVWTTVPLAAPESSTGGYIEVDTASDVIRLRGGSVYLIMAEPYFKSTASSGLQAFVRVRSIGGTVYCERQIQLTGSSTTHRAAVFVSGVVGVSVGVMLDVDVQIKNNSSSYASVSVDNAWITVQRIG
jgi:hypothetical protein